jgi:glycosyltransferase involved in cell wall biosynthesis
MRLLVVGWVNSPHIAVWPRLLSGRGYEVHIAGEIAPDIPDTPPPDAASVSVMPTLRTPGLRAPRLAPWLRDVAREVEADIVHAHYLSIFGYIAARAGQTPLVVSAWGSDVYRAGWLERRRSRLAIERADALVADSQALARAAVQLAQPKRLEVIGWGVDPGLFHPGDRAEARARLELPDVPIVLGPRGLEPHYNPQVLINAFERLQDDGALLVLKHPGTAVPPDIQAATGERIRLVGHVSEDELADWYRAADVVVSIPGSDSAPRTVWEAMASGTPVVVSDLPWTREHLKDGGNALLVPSEPEPVAAAIASVLGSPTRAESLARAGRETVEANMNREREMDRLDALYREVAR